MAKMIDITDKLNFEEKPVLVIKGEKIKINDDATTMLKVMQITSKKNVTNYDIGKVYELLFDPEEQSKIKEMKIPYKNLVTLIDEAINVVTGGDDTEDTQ